VCRRWHLQRDVYNRFSQVTGEMAELISRQIPQGTVCSWVLEKKERELILRFSCDKGSLVLPDDFRSDDVERVIQSESALDSLSAHIIRSRCDSLKEVEEKGGKALVFTWSL
jgi:hypothetical protein